MKKLLIILLIIVVLITAAFILMTVNLDKIITGQIARVTGSDAQIESFNFNLLTGFHLNNLTITFPQDTVSQTVEEVIFDYSPFSLFKKQLLITAIQVRSPSFNLYQSDSGQWNIPDELLLYMQNGSSQTDPSASMVKLPVRLLIKKIEVFDARLEINIPTVGVDARIEKGSVSDLHFKSQEDFAGLVVVSGIDIGFRSENPALSGNIFADMESTLSDSVSSFQVYGHMVENSGTIGELPQASFTSEMNVDVFSRHLAMKGFTFEMGDSEKISASGTIKASFADKDSVEFETLLRLDRCKIGGGGFISDLIRRFNPDLENLNFNLIEPSALKASGSINLKSGRKVISISASHHSVLKDFRIQNNPAQIDNVNIGMNLSLSVIDSSLALENCSFKLEDIYSDAMKMSVEEVNIRTAGDFGIEGSDLVINDFSGSMNVISPNVKADMPVDIVIDSISSEFYYTDAKFIIENEISSGEVLNVAQDISLNVNRLVLANEPSIRLFDHMNIKMNIDMGALGLAEGVKGKLEAEFKAGNHDSLLKIEGSLIPLTALRFEAADSVITIPFDYLKAHGDILFDEKFDSIAVRNLKNDISGWLRNTIQIDIIGKNQVNLFIEDGIFDLKKLLEYPQLKQYVPVEIEPVAEYSGNISMPLLNINRLSGEFGINIPPFGIEYNEFDISGIASECNISFNGFIIDIEGNSLIEQVSAPTLRPRPLKSLYGNLDGKLNLNQKKLRFELTSGIESESIGFKASGETDLSQPTPVTNITSDFSLAKPEKYEVYPGFFIQGEVNSTLKAKIENALHISGAFSFDDFSIYSPFAEISGVGGEVPFSQVVEFVPFDLSKDGPQFNPFYPDFRQYDDWSKQSINNVSTKRVRVKGRELTDISADVYWKNSYFRLPHYQLALFDGNISGSAWMRLDSLLAGKVSYNIIAQGAEINSDRIAELKTRGGKASKIAFSFDFTGKGLVPTDPDFDVSGAMHITQISPKVAENMLLALDPQQQDKGIQSTLYFLKKGWGVRSISFEVAHGFVYSSIITQQPPPKKPLPFIVSKLLPLEKEIRLSRLPLKFFVK